MSSRDDQNEEVESINDESVNAEENSTEDSLAKLKSEYLYLRAEFDNYRKNTIKERSQLIRYGAEPLLRELLTVLDNFDLALNTKIDSENIVSFKQGMEMTAKEFRGVLTKFGLKEENNIIGSIIIIINIAKNSQPNESFSINGLGCPFFSSSLLLISHLTSYNMQYTSSNLKY